eukprot:1833259-Heterocapsa_arctica.AAC.1
MPTECIRAFQEVLSIIGNPEQIYHDNEGSFNSTLFIRLCNEKGIKQIITSTPPHFAERATQPIKNMIRKRLDGLELKKEQWVEALPSVINKYNNTEHSTPGVKPTDATKR